MTTVLVTGAAGFIGRNLVAALQRREDVQLLKYDLGDDPASLERSLAQAEVIFHLAGVNRPVDDGEFATGNAGFTQDIIAILERFERTPLVVMSSSVQAELDNPYGRSKLTAEQALQAFAKRSGAAVAIYRLANVFGKWSRPNYNTVVATFCHNIARGLDIVINDPDRELELVYIDDVVVAFLGHLSGTPDLDRQRYTVSRSFRVTLGELAGRIRELHAIRSSLVVPDLSDEFTQCLHATYLSFLPEDAFATPVKLNRDERGWLFELIKSPHFGQIFVSKTLPGIARGNHYHDTKLEKFCVIQGAGVIRFRRIDVKETLEYVVDDRVIQIVDIPPGYTHSIENTGSVELICLFWANQIFDPEHPDTTFLPVVPG